MNRKYLHSLTPNIDKLKNTRGFYRIACFLEKKPYLFVMKRHNFALGLAIGLGWGIIPLPIQVIFSLITSYIFKANIQAALLGTLITNPLTAPFFLALSYNMGKLFLDSSKIDSIIFPESQLMLSNFSAWWAEMQHCIQTMGEALLVGIPVTAVMVGILTYFVTKWVWFWTVVFRRKQRLRRYAATGSNHKENKN